MNTITQLKNAVMKSVLEETDFPAPNALAINFIFDNQLHLISGPFCFGAFIDNIKEYSLKDGHFAEIPVSEEYFTADVETHFLDDDFTTIEFRLIWDSYHKAIVELGI